MVLDLDDVPQLNTDKYNKGKSLKVVKLRRFLIIAVTTCTQQKLQLQHTIFITIIIMLDYVDVNEAMHSSDTATPQQCFRCIPDPCPPIN